MFKFCYKGKGLMITYWLLRRDSGIHILDAFRDSGVIDRLID